MTWIDTLFDDFQHTAFRLEQRPSYNVGGAEAVRIRAHHDRTARPERSVRTEAWLARIARTTTVDGKQWRRLRVVDSPLTEYQRYQLGSGSYVENQAAGDETRIIERDVVGPWLRYDAGRRLLGDLWVFDVHQPTEVVVAQDYTADGQFVGHRVVTDPDERAAAVVAVDAFDFATPLGEFLVSRAGEVHVV